LSLAQASKSRRQLTAILPLRNRWKPACVAFGLIYGALDALIYPYVSFVQAVNGPVFQLVGLAYFLVILLGVPGLLVGMRDGLRGATDHLFRQPFCGMWVR